MTGKTNASAYMMAIVFGLAVWISISKISGSAEAWDSPLYFAYGIPGGMVAMGVIGYIWPSRPWRWPLAMTVAQASLAIAQNPTANMLPLGLIAFGLLAIPSLATVYLGAFLRRKFVNLKK